MGWDLWLSITSCSSLSPRHSDSLPVFYSATNGLSKRLRLSSSQLDFKHWYITSKRELKRVRIPLYEVILKINENFMCAKSYFSIAFHSACLTLRLDRNRDGIRDWNASVGSFKSVWTRARFFSLGIIFSAFFLSHCPSLLLAQVLQILLEASSAFCGKH